MSKDGGTLTADSPSGGRSFRARKIRVEIVRGPGAGEVFDRPGLSQTVGKDETCNIRLQDPTVSRLHLTVSIEDGMLRVRDEGSHNGTFIDGVRVRDAYARPDSLLTLGNTVLRLQMLPDEVELPLSARDHFGQLYGESVAMRRVFAELERAAASPVSVLIEGETGTGKELAAEGIHQEGRRRGGPFVVLDCSNVPSTLVESEMFGHVRGAFTGAVAERRGRFEEANGGTLFLDELGELPLDLQPKLLRALEAKKTRRLGDDRVRSFDVRIVAATNRSLLREVERGRFREDLYYRIAARTIRMPPLRERPDDIPQLIKLFEKQVAPEGAPPLPEEVVRAFAARSWPGNVRALRNAVEVAHWFGLPRLEGEDPELPLPAIQPALKLGMVSRQAIGAAEKPYLVAALQQTGGNVKQAAKLLGIARTTLQDKMKKLGLRGNKK